MDDKQYFSQVYEVARLLNGESSMHSALRNALKKTIELLELKTGWIWLLQPDLKSVYLAASHNLPPALRDYPERLSGWCYCIKEYLENDLSSGRNISEITCTRLKDLNKGTRNLKFHASIPITAYGQKIGLINLVSKHSQELSKEQLTVLSTIGHLMGMAVQRTRIQPTANASEPTYEWNIIKRILIPRIDSLTETMTRIHDQLSADNSTQLMNYFEIAFKESKELHEQIHLIFRESAPEFADPPTSQSLRYPGSPLTNRELQVLNLVKRGLTNREIADQLFIAERTVKFHLSSVFSKLAAKTRTHAVQISLQRGLISS